MTTEVMNAEVSNIPGVAIDRLVPGFTARSTRGELSLSDYRNRWVILFSHPADFTPVCTSEFIAFERASDQFEAMNCALLGLSVDSIYAHVAWLRNIHERFGVEITFPVIEDISMSIARAYGMIDEGSNSTATVRAVYFIDPTGILRAKIHYPMQVGRSVAEILRTLAALQAADEHGMTAPEDWQPGDALVPLAPITMEEAGKSNTSRDRADWYYASTRS